MTKEISCYSFRNDWHLQHTCHEDRSKIHPLLAVIAKYGVLISEGGGVYYALFAVSMNKIAWWKAELANIASNDAPIWSQYFLRRHRILFGCILTEAFNLMFSYVWVNWYFLQLTAHHQQQHWMQDSRLSGIRRLIVTSTETRLLKRTDCRQYNATATIRNIR